MTPADPGTGHPSPPHARTALVTGAGRGIGRGLALGLAAHGYDVALVGRTAAHLDAVAGQVTAARPGARVVTAAVDVTDPAAVRDAVARAEDALGGIGLLVNNAGVIERTEGPFAEDDVTDAWRVLETNVRGPLNVTHAVLGGMLARGGGRVVNLNSGAGHRTGGAYTAYGVSKGALARFTSFLDAQYRDRGVRAFDLAPGVVRTDMTQAMPTHGDRTDWTALEDVVELLLALADGRLDRLSGRFVRAGSDTAEDLEARTDQILAADARCLRLVPYGPDDPVAG